MVPGASVGMLVTLSRECDTVLKNRKRFNWNGKRTLTGGGVENSFLFFFQKSKAINELAKAEGMEKLIESLPIPAHCNKADRQDITFSISSYSTYYEGEITHPVGPLDIWGHLPELFSSSREQLFRLQGRKFIHEIGIVAVNFTGL
jgi:hypothetical protein